MKINQAVGFFANGLNRKSEKKELTYFGKNDLGREDAIAKIFNFGNHGAYVSFVRGENEKVQKFSLGISQSTMNPNQKGGINKFIQELKDLKKASTVTVENIACKLYVTKNVHLATFYDMVQLEKQLLSEESNQINKAKVTLRKEKRNKSKDSLYSSYMQKKISELENNQAEINKKISFIKKVESCNDSSDLHELLITNNRDYTLLKDALIDAVNKLFIDSIKEINELSMDNMNSIEFQLVSKDQPHVEIVALNNLLDKNADNPLDKFTVGLDRYIGNIASCPGCRSYFEGIRERNKVEILYISHNQLPRDFNLNGISEQRQYDFLCKYKQSVSSIFPNISANVSINDNKELIELLDQSIHGENKISSIFAAYNDLNNNPSNDKAKHYIKEQITYYYGDKQLGNKFKKNKKDKNDYEDIFNDLIFVIINDLLGKYAGIKKKDPINSEKIQKYIFSQFDLVLQKYESQYKGKNIDEKDGLYKSDIEYNLELIKKSINCDVIKEKITHISNITIEKNQRIYVINPESNDSKFSDTLAKNLKEANIINAHLQVDNSTCADHSLILLTKMLQLDVSTSQIGIAGVVNEHGKHASLYIVANDNVNLSGDIDEVIISYKNEGEIIGEH